ncbi:DUF4231 domain-containing protein [Streptomyces sp. Amel2xB2]|uniref:DUF4231 domain-containing protein n=1 Tax=Streptomyces sp. Amel2xB2 TaxID=1305829 RepID=UPI000DBA99AD|nr:DUF4231 domain-containing protein [Streptomyces sp. Amel2xB2]
MSQHGGGTTLLEIWDQQSVWSQAADRRKSAIGRARALALTLGIAAAVLGTAASQTMDAYGAAGKTLAFAAALAAGLVPLAAGRAGPAAIRDWTLLRSVSEAIKNEAYVFLAGVAPYRGPAASAVLRDRVDRLRADAADLLPHTEGITPVPRTPPEVTDVDSYIQRRVRQQIDGYYRPKSAAMGRRLTLVRRAELLLGCAGAVLGAVSGAYEVEAAAAWVAVATLIGAAVSTHAVTSRYAYQQIEYARTADELDRLITSWRSEPTSSPAAADAFVDRCERVVSVLNDSWMIKWTTE